MCVIVTQNDNTIFHHKKKEKRRSNGRVFNYDQVVSLDGQRLMARSWVFDHGDPTYGRASTQPKTRCGSLWPGKAFIFIF
jgi:hypothetical protein